MHRFLQNYVVQESDSIVSNDYNWDEISVGNDTLAVDRFFGLKKPDMQNSEQDINDFEIVFEDTVDESERSEKCGSNDENIVKVSDSLSLSDALSSSLDEAHIGEKKKIRSQQPRNIGPRPLNVHNPKVPNVVRAGQIYEVKKKLRMEQLEKLEREMRRFHAKPAPDFSTIHAAQKRSTESKITVPVTPRVVRTHRENLKKREAKLLEIETAQNPKPFVSKDADVLFKAPFVPQHSKKSTTEQKPFNLHSDERLRERRQFDVQIKLDTDRKEREQEERLKAEDEQIRREIRKATTFKANPNPFS